MCVFLQLSAEIDLDILSLHKYVRDIYSKRYAELESLITNPIEYVRIAKTIANETVSKNNFTHQSHTGKWDDR